MLIYQVHVNFCLNRANPSSLAGQNGRKVNLKYLKLLNEFSNSHSLATNIKVDITEHQKSFKPKESTDGANYDEVVFLSSLIQGAESFCYFLSRKGYKILKCHKKTPRSVTKVTK